MFILALLALLVAGRATTPALKRAYEAVPEPKLVFRDRILCLRRRDLVVYGVALALGVVEKRVVPAEYHPMKFPIVRYHPEDIHIENGWPLYDKLEKV